MTPFWTAIFRPGQRERAGSDSEETARQPIRKANASSMIAVAVAVNILKPWEPIHDPGFSVQEAAPSSPILLD